MARLILSAGMFSALAATMAPRKRGLVSGSPPFLAAIEISLIRRVKILPRLASRAPFLCLIVAHFECPDMEIPRVQYTSIALILIKTILITMTLITLILTIKDAPVEEITALPSG